MNWDDFRRLDGSIDLLRAYSAWVLAPASNKVTEYLETLESLQRIHSRQVAATALVAARQIHMEHKNA